MAIMAARLRRAIALARAFSTVSSSSSSVLLQKSMSSLKPSGYGHLCGFNNQPSPPSRRISARCRVSNSGSVYSPLDSNSTGQRTTLFEGTDYNHWLVTMEWPDPQPSREEKIDAFVKTLANIVGSEEEAKKRIYALSTTTYTGFMCEISEELSEKIKKEPGVVWVLPDSYADPINKTYGVGDKYINGVIIPDTNTYNNRSSGRYNDRPRNRRRDSMPLERRDVQVQRDPQLQVGGRDTMQSGSVQGDKQDYRPAMDGRGSMTGHGQDYRQPPTYGRGSDYRPPSMDGRGQDYRPPSMDGRGQDHMSPPMDGRGQDYRPTSMDGRGQDYRPTSMDGRGQHYMSPPMDGRGQHHMSPPMDGRGQHHMSPPMDRIGQDYVSPPMDRRGLDYRPPMDGRGPDYRPPMDGRGTNYRPPMDGRGTDYRPPMDRGSMPSGDRQDYRSLPMDRRGPLSSGYHQDYRPSMDGRGPMPSGDRQDYRPSMTGVGPMQAEHRDYMPSSEPMQGHQRETQRAQGRDPVQVEQQEPFPWPMEGSN